MSIFPDIFLAALIAGIVLLTAALVLPVRIMARGRGDTDNGFVLSGRVMPFAGLCGIGITHDGSATRLGLYLGSWRLVSVPLPAGGKGVKRMTGWVGRRKPEAPEEKEEKRLSDRIRGMAVKGRNMGPLIFRTLREAMRLVRFDRCYADIRFGLGDPGFTGMLAGIVYTLNGMLPASCTIAPSWDFTRTVAGGEIDMKVSILNYRFWGAMVRLVPDMLRMRRTVAGATP